MTPRRLAALCLLAAVAVLVALGRVEPRDLAAPPAPPAATIAPVPPTAAESAPFVRARDEAMASLHREHER